MKDVLHLAGPKRGEESSKQKIRSEIMTKLGLVP